MVRVMQPKFQHEQIHPNEYWAILRRRRNLVLIFACAVIAVTMAVSYGMQPVYRASAQMAIDKQSTTSPVTGQRTESIDIHSQQLTSNTHFRLITSKPVIEYMLKQYDYPEEEAENDAEENLVRNILLYARHSGEKLKSYFRPPQAEKKETPEEKLLERKIYRVLRKTKISPVRETRLLYIHVDDHNPVVAAQIANQLAKSYIEFDLASQLNAEKQNLEWLNKELLALKKRLEEDEKKFYDYKQQHKVFSLEGMQKGISQKIFELNNEYLVTKSKRQELDAKLEEIKKQYTGRGDIAYVRSILENKTLDAIYTNLTALELESNRLGKVFKSRHPKIQQVNSEIAKVSSKFEAELNKEIENLKVQQSILLNREKDIEAAIGEFEEDALDTSSKELDYTILQRNMETSQRLYDTLVAKIKETGIASSGVFTNLRIVEQAVVPTKPMRPNKKKNFFLSLLFGIVGGVGLAFLMEYLDQTIRTDDDVRNYLGLPVLSVVPAADSAEKKG